MGEKLLELIGEPYVPFFIAILLEMTLRESKGDLTEEMNYAEDDNVLEIEILDASKVVELKDLSFSLEGMLKYKED